MICASCGLCQLSPTNAFITFCDQNVLLVAKLFRLIICNSWNCFFFLKEKEKMIFNGNRQITKLPGFFYFVRSAKDEISLCQAAGSGLEISSVTR